MKKFPLKIHTISQREDLANGSSYSSLKSIPFKTINEIINFNGQKIYIF